MSIIGIVPTIDKVAKGISSVSRCPCQQAREKRAHTSLGDDVEMTSTMWSTISDETTKEQNCDDGMEGRIRGDTSGINLNLLSRYSYWIKISKAVSCGPVRLLCGHARFAKIGDFGVSAEQSRGPASDT